ncbi:MAG TPA: sodium/glutamate symporter [Pyrinomonadaceae bacterium]|nr:sodium/glutamate symporter [Pyrinomonadaceae bacterium]
MEVTAIEGLRTVRLDLIMTLALAALLLFAGSFVQRRVRLFERSSIPAAAIGGLLFALLALALRRQGALGFSLDTTLRGPLQIAFFTTIGLSATATLLRSGGWRMGLFWAIATVSAVVQNAVGMALALGLGAPVALGIVCGALTLSGGPATAQAWAAEFEALGIEGAGAVSIASALFGIFTACIVGNPVATALIRRFKLARARGAAPARGEGEEEFWALSPTVSAKVEGEEDARVEDLKAPDGPALLHNLLVILALMGLGALLSLWIKSTGFTLPDYIGAMILAAAARNLDDRTGWLRLNPRAVEALGGVALALFLVIALMSLELWRIAGLALPMLIILAVQVVVMVAFAVLVTFVVMGRDYEAAVTASGHIGFGLGITANAVANMEALTARYAPAPRSFMIVPVVGAFFIDFSNLLVITVFVNFLK